MHTLSPPATHTTELTSTQSIVLVFLLGAVILGIVGFSNSATIHDATHDVRHAAGFPCH